MDRRGNGKDTVLVSSPGIEGSNLNDVSEGCLEEGRLKTERPDKKCVVISKDEIFSFQYNKRVEREFLDDTINKEFSVNGHLDVQTGSGTILTQMEHATRP